ncbi:MAG: DUF1043 family protein [Pseudomonadota bacterium]
MVSPLILLVIGFFCFIVGLAIGYWFTNMDKSLNASRVDAAKQELAEYKEHVSSHFEKSAEHFEAIGRQYRELYDHMAASAETLLPSDAGAAGERNPFPRIGATVAAAAAAVEAVEAATAEVSEPVSDEAVEPTQESADTVVSASDSSPSDVATEDTVEVIAAEADPETKAFEPDAIEVTDSDADTIEAEAVQLGDDPLESSTDADAEDDLDATAEMPAVKTATTDDDSAVDTETSVANGAAGTPHLSSVEDDPEDDASRERAA